MLDTMVSISSNPFNIYSYPLKRHQYYYFIFLRRKLGHYTKRLNIAQDHTALMQISQNLNTGCLIPGSVSFIPGSKNGISEIRREHH